MGASDLKESLAEKSSNIESEGTVGIKKRTIIWFLAFSGFAVNFVITNNVPFAIINMVDSNFQSSNESNQDLQLIQEMNNETNVDEHPVDIAQFISLERRLLDFLNIEYERNGFKWDEHKQAQVLGSFFWIHWASQLPGGILAAKYGTKLVFGLSHFLASLMSLMMPFFCYLDYRWMVALRLIQGLIMGLTWPAMHNLVGQWIPPNERSGFVSAYFGGSVGVALAFPLFGVLTKISSWESIFHVCGIIGIVWYILWLYFVYDTPEKHPHIHPKEKEFILNSLGSSVTQNSEKKADIPWIAILTSSALWVNTIGHWGAVYSFLTLVTQMPSYFSNIHGMKIEATGLLSGLPHFLLIMFSISFSKFADYLLSTEKMSRNNVRRFAGVFSFVLNGCAMIALAYFGSNMSLAAIFMTLSLCCNGAVSTSVLSSIVDMAPNYAGITMGITSTIASMGGFVSPMVIGYLTFENQNIQAWQHIFEISAVMLFASGVIYIGLIDTKVQKWNNVQEVYDYPEEIEPLHTNEEKVLITEMVNECRDKN